MNRGIKLMKNTIVYATASYLPDNTVFNAELTQFPETSIPKIAEKTGVLSRRIAPEEMCTSDLAIKAGLACLEKAGFPADKLQGIIVSTSSPDRIQPPTATRTQAGLNAPQAFAFDINSVCSGSTYGICMADALIRSGMYDNILFIAAEMYSKILYKHDFGTLPYFGDGAGAILFRPGIGDGKGVLHSSLGTDGHLCETVGVFGGGTIIPFEKMDSPKMAYLKMNGRGVKEFAMKRGPGVVLRLLEETGVSVDDVDCFICHQANINIVNAVADIINAPREKFFVNLDRYGNTASASVLIALDEAITCGMIHEGSQVVTVSFGGGLSYGANLIRF
jgi:3-oxoacyl-[acyl-carrier-protein] synthase-3